MSATVACKKATDDACNCQACVAFADAAKADREKIRRVTCPAGHKSLPARLVTDQKTPLPTRDLLVQAAFKKQLDEFSGKSLHSEETGRAFPPT